MSKKKVIKVIATPGVAPKAKLKVLTKPEDKTGLINECFSISGFLQSAEAVKVTGDAKAKERVKYAVDLKAYLKQEDLTYLKYFIAETGKREDVVEKAVNVYHASISRYKAMLPKKELLEMGVKPRKNGAESGKPKSGKKDNTEVLPPLEMAEKGIRSLNNKALLMAVIEESIALYNEKYGSEGVKISLTFTKKEMKKAVQQ